MGVVVAAAAAAALNCWGAAAYRYNLPVELLYAIGQQESQLKPHVVAVNNNGTRDIGVMQVNSSWLPVLERYGITERHLLDACTNIQVGSWILAQEVQRYGYTWQAIGAYNAGACSRRSCSWKIPIYRRYSEKVLARWHKLRQGRGKGKG